MTTPYCTKPLQKDPTTGALVEAPPTIVSPGAAASGACAGLNASGQLDLSVMPSGIGPDVQTVITSEAVAAGALVNVYNATGTPTCRNADNTTSGKEANGFVLAAVGSGVAATVYGAGMNTQVTGLTAGAVFLGAAGGTTQTVPSGAGKVLQRVGTAMAPGELSFVPDHPIVLAS